MLWPRACPSICSEVKGLGPGLECEAQSGATALNSCL